MLKRIRLEHEYCTLKDWSFMDTGAFWDSVYNYDEACYKTYSYERRFYDSFGLCSARKNGRFLDVDCRTGNGTVFYFQRGMVKDALCLSPSRVLLDVAKRNLREHKIRGSARLLERIPLDVKSKSFDTILCLETIEHLPERQRLAFLRELSRLLKDEGELILTTPNVLWEFVHWVAAVLEIHPSEGPHRFLSRDSILKCIKLSGFIIKREKTTVLIPYGPRFITRIGEFIERLAGEPVMRLIGLRRIFILKKSS